jgi:hypothetical protein
VAVFPVVEIEDVPAFNVMLVESVMFQIVPVLDRVTVLAPRVSVLVLVLFDEKVPAVTK